MDKNKVTTIKDIAKYTGFSIATVSNVINKKEIFYSEDTYKKIIKAIKKLNYYPNIIARGLVKRKTNSIAFLIPLITDFFSKVLIGIQESANVSEYSISLYSSQYNTDKEEKNVKSIISNKADGVILSSTILDDNNLKRIEEKKIPYVLIEDFKKVKGTNYVTVDNRIISKKAVNYLIELGHKKIGVIGETLKIPTISERIKGYKDALFDNKIKFNKSNVFINDSLHEEFFENGYEYTKGLIKENPEITAYFITSDIIAISALRAIKDLGLKVPEDISIIGFDGLEVSKFIYPKLTTVSLPRYEMGYEAMNMLLKIIDKKATNNIKLEAKLIIGESTGKVRKSGN